MPRIIPLLILIACSLSAAILLFALSLSPGDTSAFGAAYTSAYAALTMDESVPDREVTEALNRVFNGQILSESSQWVFLDDFGELQQIPLDRYGDRLESFDPRNDGYAERVRSFFVRDGKRFFFIPETRDIEKKIRAALGDAAWSLEVWNQRRPEQRFRGFYLILFAAAAITGLFCMKFRLLGAVLFPVFGGLCLRGASGFALAAILSLLPDLLGEPVREFCYVLRNRKSRSGSGRRGRAVDHIPFIPVPIFKSSLKRLRFSRAILPFALASCLALPVSGTFAAGDGFIEDEPLSPPLISAAEYQAHAEYQRYFSLVPLGRKGFDEVSYFHYDMDEDGLLKEGASEAGVTAFPPFPLEDLMDFLGRPSSAVEMRGMDVFELLPVLLVLLLCIPVLGGGGQGKGKKKESAVYFDKSKRIAA
ncbi:hypothetical protein FACS189491_04590 [Spirochaetia bacterium]|nr:hypothetical protein FACS189491_04590 [Spirochaetia bacterium]